MVSFTDVNAENPETGEFQQNPAVMAASAASFFTFAWLASGRPAEDVNGAKGSKINEGIRTSTSIFCRGLKERITFNTSSGVPWEWRRIVFHIKKADFQDTGDPNTSKFFRITSNGMARLVTLIPNEDIFIELFDGARFQDWLDPLNAKLNTRLIDVKYDQVRQIRSGNDSGVIRHYNLWHPVNKNIVYEDEQDGEGMFTSALSTGGKPGAGDMYVVDIFRPGAPSDSTDLLSFLPQSTFYWHEK